MAAQTLTFLFTDIEGSTTMLQRLGDAYAQVLADHHRLIRDALAAHDGKEIDTQGDAFFAVFSSVTACVRAAITMQRSLAGHAWPAGQGVRVRMGIHSGEATRTAAGLVGLDVHRAARIAAAAHGGQIVLSAVTAALLPDSLPEGAWLKDLGVHRLKDLSRPEALFQLAVSGLPVAFPPLRSLGSAKPPTNLPAQVSSFIGREEERAKVRHLATTFRLVTLTGPAGVGKTRLGLHVAARVLDDGPGDGVWFADLAPLGDQELVTVTVADVLGVPEDPGRTRADTLIEAVGDQHMLILLDNCEHVIDACAKLADMLLRSCPNVRLLATSREPLGVDGERVHRVRSLDTPSDGDDAETIRGMEAVRLFADRAARQDVTLAWDERSALVAGRVCRRLDGLPLAIELAAARLRVMSVAELDARLDQRFAILTGGSRTALPRQQTLLAMLDWSWELLNSAERQVLARLSVFAGGFDLAAAEAVTAEGDVPADTVIGHLGALVDKNLVQFDDMAGRPVRYRLLETVRQYATRQLDRLGAPAGDARRAHHDHYLALAEAAAPRLVGGDQSEWLDRLELELGNMRAAMAYCLKRRDLAPGIRLAWALRLFWKARGHATEGLEALQALLELPAPGEQAMLRARGLAAAAYLLEQTGGYATAEKYCAEGLAIARAAGDDNLVADLLYLHAFVMLRRGEPDRALPFIDEGLGLARQQSDPHVTAHLLDARTFALDLLGDHAGAARDARESVLLYRQAGDQQHAGTMLGNLGYAELALGQLDTARAHLVESLDIARALNDHHGMVGQSLNLGFAEYQRGCLAAAEDLFTKALNLARRMRMSSSIAYALIGLAMTGRDRAAMNRSARLHGAADAALVALGESIEPLEASLRDRDRQRLRVSMGAEAFEAEYAAGRAMTAEEILVLALGERV